MDSKIVKDRMEKIRLQEILVNTLKQEMDALYSIYDERVGPQTTREEEGAIEAVCWAKETQWSAAKHELSMMQIRLYNHKKNLEQSVIKNDSTATNQK